MSRDRSHSFALTCRIADRAGVPQREALLRSLEVVVRELGLALQTSAGPELSFVITGAKRDARSADRREIARWALTRSELADYCVGPLRAASSDAKAVEVARTA